MELFKENFPDTNPSETFSLTTSKGQCEVISYYGNEIGFFWKLKSYSQGQLLIITQSDVTWIEDLLQEQFRITNFSDDSIPSVTFESLLKMNYGLSLNFNKFSCVSGHEDVVLLKKHFQKIVDFIRQSQVLGNLSQGDLSFDASNSSQIILQQVLDTPLSTRGEFYEFILHDGNKLRDIFSNLSLKNAFLGKLRRLGFESDSTLRKHLLSNDFPLARKEIELVIYSSIYHYLSQFENSPITTRIDKMKTLKNSPKYQQLFLFPGLEEGMKDESLYLSSEELFKFKGIQTYIDYIELKEHTESDQPIIIDDFSEAIGVFQFEWIQLIRDDESLQDIYSQATEIFQPTLFHQNLKLLNAWYILLNLSEIDISKNIPDWKLVYEEIIPNEELYQDLKYSDIQNRVLSYETKEKALKNYETIIKAIHEHYYNHLFQQYESGKNLVSSVLEGFEGIPQNGVLLVFDGMRFDFWKILRDRIEQSGLPITITEEIRYAIAPTITEVSRSSIFSNSIAYKKKEMREFKGTYITSEPEFYEQFNPKDKLTGMVLRFIDNRIHISNSAKGEFIDFEGIQEDFTRYIDSYVIPMLKFIFTSRSVKVFITSDHGFINLDKKNRILDEVYDESIKESIKHLNTSWDFENYSDMFFVSPSSEVTQRIENQYQKDIIIIHREDYCRYHIPVGLGGDAIIFPKVYRHLCNASLKYNHGSLSMFETMVPFVKLEFK